jgi:hypothetical protein
MTCDPRTICTLESLRSIMFCVQGALGCAEQQVQVGFKNTGGSCHNLDSAYRLQTTAFFMSRSTLYATQEAAGAVQERCTMS